MFWSFSGLWSNTVCSMLDGKGLRVALAKRSDVTRAPFSWLVQLAAVGARSNQRVHVCRPCRDDLLRGCCRLDEVDREMKREKCSFMKDAHGLHGILRLGLALGVCRMFSLKNSAIQSNYDGNDSFCLLFFYTPAPSWPRHGVDSIVRHFLCPLDEILVRMYID